MGSEPFTQGWEMIVGRDVAASLIPRGQLRRLQRPVDLPVLPDGAYGALTGSVGRHELEDLLLVPAVIQPVGPPWRRRCRYAPLCVLGIGERGLGLWTEACPSPGVQVALSLDAIAAIERQADGRSRRLTVTGAGASLTVRYDADGDASAEIWTRRLRLRCAGQPGAPDTAADARWRSPDGRRSCLLAVTGQEIIVVDSARALSRPWRRRTRTLYVSRGSVTDAAVTDGALRLRSAGADVRVPVPSRNLAAAASRWLERPVTLPCAGGRSGSAGPPPPA